MAKINIDAEIQKLEALKEAKPTVNIKGKQLYTPKAAEANIIADIEATKRGTGAPSFAQMKLTPDGGGYTSTAKEYVQAIPDKVFANRVMVSRVKCPEIGNSTYSQYQVVTDYRAIQEQSSGSVYTEAIVVHLIAVVPGENDGDTAKLVYRGSKTIGSIEFINKFKEHLDNDSMALVLKVIDENAVSTTSASAISISV